MGLLRGESSYYRRFLYDMIEKGSGAGPCPATKASAATTDAQPYLSIGVPMVFNTVLLTVFTTMIDKRMDDRIRGLNQR
jgi:hypothetical protein